MLTSLESALALSSSHSLTSEHLVTQQTMDVPWNVSCIPESSTTIFSIQNVTNSVTNVTISATNVTEMSWKNLPVATGVILITLYTLTTIAAVVGNSVAIIIFTKGKRSNTDLRYFLLNLAIADLIMAIFCIPFTLAYQIADTWIFSNFMCPVVQGCQVVSVTASVSTNTAIGIDRLLAVKFPLRRKVTDSRSRLFILSIWVFAVSLGAIPFFMSRTILKRDGKMACEEHFLDEEVRVVYGFFITIVTYFLPVTVLSVTYIMIGMLLWRHKLPGNADDHRDAAQLKSKRKVVKMLITIVLLFGLCWLPLHLFTTATLTFRKNVFGESAYKIYFGVHWLSMANSFVNPVIYSCMNETFRADLKHLTESCSCCTSKRTRLKYRPPAVRRRLGGSNVHDFHKHTPNTFMWHSGESSLQLN